VPYNTLLDQHVLVSYAYIAATLIEEIIVYQVSQAALYQRSPLIFGEWWFALAFALSYLGYNIQWVLVSLAVRHRNVRYRDPAALLEEEEDEDEKEDIGGESSSHDNVRLVTM